MDRNDIFTLPLDNGWRHEFPEYGAGIDIVNLHDNGRGLTGELSVEFPLCMNILSNASINLQSHSQRTRLAIDIQKKIIDGPILDWDAIIELAIKETIDLYRQPPETVNVSITPSQPKIDFIIEPILPEKQPTTIFSMGGKGKSILADYFAVLCAHGVSPELPIVARRANVLICDYESDSFIHSMYINAIEKGLELPHGEIHYLSCNRSLRYLSPHIMHLIEKHDIELVIIDSQMAATADNPRSMTEWQIASDYYNQVRMLGITTLTIDHVTKQNMSEITGQLTPYGSIVKYNRSRCQWELKQTQEVGENIIEIGLFHRKNNLGGLLKPIGIKIEFINNESDALDKILVTPGNLEANITLSKALPLKDQVKMLLLDYGPMAVNDIAIELGANKDSVRACVTGRWKDKVFTKVGDKWGIAIDG